MMTLRLGIIISGLMLAMYVCPVLATKQNPRLHHTGSATASAITEEQAFAIAQQHIKGRVLAINLIDQVYRIKILDPQGTMHIIMIDAQRGAIVPAH
ncbi:MAG: PepSY domain-containing protein [Nitrosomonas sp.]|nr:MAG: PepSY domain-containing protein [Nitrosomonas sp.]